MIRVRFAPLLKRLRHVGDDVSGNVLMLTASGIMMLTVAAGFGVDYSRAVQIRTKINSAADAAALVSVDPAMFNQTDAAAVATATALFNSRVSGIPGVTITSLTITAPTTTSSVASASRTATVTWTATVDTTFSGVLGKSTITVSGTAVANAAEPPDINFFVVLDNSPSMLLPTTSSGISLLESRSPNTCAFSCHIADIVYGEIKDKNGNIIILDNTFYNTGTTQDAGGYRYNDTSKKVFNANYAQIGTTGSVAANPTTGAKYASLTYKNMSGTWVTVNTYPADPFWLAQNFGKAYDSPARIPMRIDDELTAAQQLISTAQTTQSSLSTGSNPVQYKMQFYTLNYAAAAMTPSLGTVNSLNPADLVPANGTITPFMRKSGYHPTIADPNAYPGFKMDNYSTWTNAGLSTMNGVMPNPGTGAANSTPQEVLIIVTDGYQDENGVRQQWNSSTIAQCTAIKDRGIRIAILYTTYDPATISSHYPSYAAVTPNIAPALKSCASTTSGGANLMYTVSVNEDISAALSALFSMTVQTAHLTK